MSYYNTCRSNNINSNWFKDRSGNSIYRSNNHINRYSCNSLTRQKTNRKTRRNNNGNDNRTNKGGVISMVLNIEPDTPMDVLKNNEEVRIFRLHLMEQNQIKILEKISELESKIEDDYMTKISDHEKRIALLEECCENYTRVKWLIIGEAIVILGFIIKNVMGV